MVVRNSQVTKHFYIESQRIVTKLNDKKEGLLQDKAGTATVDYTAKASKLKASILKNYKDLNIDRVDGEAGNSGQTPPNGNAWGYWKDKDNNGNDGNNGGGNDGNGGNTGSGVDKPDKFIYFYHPDHLGSSSYITDVLGEVVQHIEYFAFGETFLEEHSNTDRTPYLFNGKELDEETGLYYYGARYYDARTSVWQSVDPLAGYNPIFEVEHYIDGQHNGGVFYSGNLNVYGYTYQNPVKYIDPNGKQTDVVTYGIKNKYDDAYVRRVAQTSAKGIGVTAQGINTGQQLIGTLEGAGRIATFVNWGHSWSSGLYLNNDAGFYNNYTLGSQSANFADLSASNIKTNAHSLFIFASCGTAGDGTGYDNYSSSSFAASFGDNIYKGNDVGEGIWNYKVTTIGATALSNLLEDGTIKTDGSFIMTEKRYQISKKAVYKTTGYLWWKKQIFSHWDIKTSLLQTKTTNLGNKINPTEIIKNHDHNDTTIN